MFAGLSGFSFPAHAGFQWVSPNEQGAPPGVGMPPSVETAPMPSASQQPEVISPVVIEGQDSSPRPQLQPSSEPSLGTLSAADVAPVTSVPMGPEETVHGFANNVPLAVALRQILPPGYGFSIDQDVDLGTLVSFKGGKGWRTTLSDTLRPSGLSMREQNQMVSIGHGGAAASASGAAPSVPETVSISSAPSAPSASPAPMAMAEPSAAAPMMTPAPMAPEPAVKTRPPILSNIPPGNGPKPELAQPNIPHMNPPAGTASARAGALFSVSDTWTGERGSTLRKVLESWSSRAGVEFQWLAEYDYPMQATITFNGTFENAVRNLLSGFQDAHPEPVAELHSNSNAGQAILVVQTRGNSYSD